MPDYRLYFIDPQNHIRRATDLQAESDSSAIKQAEAHVDWGVLELWQGGRPVARLEGGVQLPIVSNAGSKTA